MTTKLPRGIRNNNPGNIRWGDPWQGLVPATERTDSEFCQFATPAHGIRAMARVLINYQDKYKIRSIKTVIGRWAPASENNTQAYIEAVSRATGFEDDLILDLHQYRDLRPLVEAIIRHECGRGPLKTANTWYSAETIDEGLRMAGVKPEPVTAGGLPATKETAGAAAGAGVGIAQIADAAPQIQAALTSADGHISSGSVVRIVFGVLIIAVAVYVAWAQVRRYQQGTL